MANNQINRLLEFASMQMAAEAFLVEGGDQGIIQPDNVIRTRLERGNFHLSKFMPVQVEQFITQYEVLAQYRNDPLLPGGSGFSATLFKNRLTEELTLSFRSTEFIDDAVRDTTATGRLEIKDLGWAFGQIAEMEAWYAQLRADPNLLGGKNFNVTGYSLGGHLATVFSILRREAFEATGDPDINPIINTYTFNGAGTGAILNGRRLTDLIADFNRIRMNYAASPEWTSLSVGERNNLVTAAQFRVDAIDAERFRVAGLSGITRAFASSAPTGNQTLLGYQIAALLVAHNTVGATNFPLPGGTNYVPSSPVFAADALRFANMTEIVGMETNGLATSYVSNSGVHYGYRHEVAIEAQPERRGTFLFQVFDQWLNLLVDNPDRNNFADTHSLVLLVDSLSLMAAMESLDPNITCDTAKEIFAAMSKAEASTLFFTQGRAEGDTLERVLDALHKLLYGSGAQTPLNYGAALAGNTWHLESLRRPFHERLKEVNTVIAELKSALAAPSYSIQSLTTLSAANLAALANKNDATGKAYRYALRELNLFAVLGNDDLYASHNINGELNLYDPATNSGLTQQYLTARTEMLGWLMKFNTANGNIALRSSQIESYQFIDKTLKDMNGSDLTLPVGGKQSATVSIPLKVIFGGELGETLIGEDVYIGDQLFGGGGDDTLIGNGGKDYLEGNAGADTLLGGFDRDNLLGGAGDDILEGGKDGDTLNGGPGFDTYRYFSSDGPDVISDHDGQGKIEYDGITLTGGEEIGENLWQSEDKRFTYSLYTESNGSDTLSIKGSGGTLFVENFVNERLGITLEDAPQPAPTPPEGGREIRGDIAPQIFVRPPDLNNPPPGHQYIPLRQDLFPNQYVLRDDLGNLVRDPARFWTGGHQDLFGSSGGDHIVGSDFGNGLAGLGGDDYLLGGRSLDGAGGGDGNDFIEGGAFADVPLEDWLNVSAPFPEGEIRGASDDRLFGMAGDDVIFGGTSADLEALSDPTTPSAGHKGDWIAGEKGDDQLYGSTGHDVLLGGSGKDVMVGGPGDDVLDGDDSFSTSHTTNPASGGWMWRIDIGSSPFDIRFFPVSVMPWLDWSDSYYKLGGDDDILLAGSGNDILIGMLGNDTLLGEDGDDILSGWEGGDTLLGGAGDDVMAGDFGGYEQPNDRLVGFTHSVPAGFLDLNTGNSGLVHQVGNDYLDGGAGSDTMYGEGGNDIVLGGEGNDTLWGDAAYLPEELHGADYLDGGAGTDMLNGGSGDNTLVGGLGDDTLSGGEGNDTYVFARGDGQDVISDQGAAGIDVLIVNDYTRNDITIRRGADGRLVIAGTSGDAITIQEFAGNANSGIELIQFADGTTLDQAALGSFAVAEDSVGGAGWTQTTDTDDVISTFGLPSNSLGGFVLVDAGAGNDVVFGGSDAVIYGNQGNDQLIGGHRLIGGDGDDLLTDGVMLIGGAGNDQLLNGAILNGGPGNDALDGSYGATRYLIAASDVGIDTIADSGESQDAILDSYYSSLGIFDWRERQFVTETEYVVIEFGVFNTLEEASAALAEFDLTWDEAVASGFARLIEPLPSAPQVSANDYAALASFYESGLIDLDSVEFGEGVGPEDLTMSWGEVAANLDFQNSSNPTPHVTLDMAWGEDKAVRVVIPRSGDPIGTGIEQFELVDGTVLSLAEMIAMAPPVPDFDPPIVGTVDPDVLFGSSGDDSILGLGGTDEIHGGAGNDSINGGGGDDSLIGGEGTDALTAGEGNDSLDGSEGNDLANGGPGDDVIYGYDGNDLLIGQSGNDLVDSQSTNNIVAFNTGDGQDTVYALNALTLSLGGGIRLDSLTLSRDGTDLVLAIGGAESIRLTRQFEPDPEAWPEIKLQLFDGANVNIYDFSAVINDLYVALDQNPALAGLPLDGVLQSYLIESSPDYAIGGDLAFQYGTHGNTDALTPDHINRVLKNPAFGSAAQRLNEGQYIGADGDDVLVGSPDADTLAGGPGNDFLDGGLGNDTYVFSPGDGIDSVTDAGGLDTLAFGDGIAPDMLTLGLGSLLIRVGESGDAIHIEGFDPNDVVGSGVIELFQFANSFALSYGELIVRGFDISGTPDDDVVFGTNVEDRISGLGGNDVLMGGEGDDTYFFDLGNGSDDIEDTGGVDTVRLGEGVTPQNIASFLEGDTLTFDFGTDQLSIRWDPGQGYEIERFEFADGTVLTGSQLALPAIMGTDGDDEIFGTDSADRIVGLGGFDSLHGEADDDWLQGGTEGDFLAGGVGNDNLEGASGSDGLIGGDGDDVLDGGAEDDDLVGGTGDDVYVFGRGYGHDSIFDDEGITGNLDAIQLNADIAPLDLGVTTDLFGALYLTVHGTADRLGIYEWFNDGGFKVESVQFFDGTIWDVPEIESRIVPAVATLFGDVLSGTGSNDVIAGLGGDDEIYDSTGNDILSGGDGDDAIEDSEGRNYLSGGAGDDAIFTGGATALLVGGAGNDYIGAYGNGNIIAFNRGDGQDTVDAFALTEGERFTLSLGGSIELAVLSLAREGSDLVIGAGMGDSIHLSGWYDTDSAFRSGGVLQLIADDVLSFDLTAAIETFDEVHAGEPDIGDWAARDSLSENLLNVSADRAIGGSIAFRYATDGHTDGMSVFSMQAALDDQTFGISAQSVTPPGTPENHAPILMNAVPNQAAQEDSSFSFTVPADTFSDTGDTLTLTATLEDGDPLPSWLNFNPTTWTLSGAPGNDEVGTLSVQVTAIDTGGLLVSDTFDIAVSNINDAPLQVSPIANQIAVEDERFTLTLSQDMFSDVDVGDSLTLAAALVGGSGLPTWLAFDAASFSFSGTPANDDVGMLSVQVMATDLAGASATGIFDLTVENINDTPVADDDTGTASEDGGPVVLDGAILLANDNDKDVGDTKSIVSITGSAAGAGVSLVGGDVVYDVAGLFQTLGLGATTTDSFSYTMVDAAGATSTATVTMTIAGMNDAPPLVNVLPDQFSNQNAAFSIPVPATTFLDVDVGDELTLTAALAEGGALPAWLAFDSFTGTFNGTPSEFDVGSLDIRLSATDQAGAAVSDTFTLSISDASTLNATHLGTRRGDVMMTGFANDLIDAGRGDDRVHAGAGRDIVFGGGGDDRLFGEAGNDRLYGGKDQDQLYGGPGFDLLYGGRGEDLLDGGAGDDLLSGGAGHDRIVTGEGENIVIGGAGRDVITGGPGRELFLVNLDDGKDELRLSGAALPTNRDVLSLGRGIDANGIGLKRDRADLIVEARDADKYDERVRITLKDWYRDAGDHQTVVTLQLFDGGTAVTYDFKALVARFDAETQGRNPTRRWSAAQALPAVALTSGAEPLGGVIAREYAMTGTVLGDVPLADEDAEERAALPGGDWDMPPTLPARDAHADGSKGELDSERDRRDASKGKQDSIVDLLEAYLANKPRYDFQTLVRELDRSDWRGNSSSALEIARRWQVVDRYVNGLSGDRDENARHGAAAGWSMEHDLLAAGALGHGFGRDGSTNITRGAANLQTLQGLNEGFDRLRT